MTYRGHCPQLIAIAQCFDYKKTTTVCAADSDYAILTISANMNCAIKYLVVNTCFIIEVMEASV